RSVGGRMVRREEGEGRRPRHPGERSSARDRDRAAAQRSAASAPRRGGQEVVGRARLEAGLSRLGAGAPHSVQEWHSGHRERRRRSRRGDGPALYLRVLPVELGPRRRLHHPPGGDRRSQGLISDREGGEVLMLVKRFSEAKSYEAPNHRHYSSLRLFGADAGGPKQFL